jgi:magnesium chelatase subunit I
MEECMHRAKTIGELRESGYRVRPVKEEIRSNLILKIERREKLFPGIVGYGKTVVPQIVNALLAQHDFILLGLRGQAKTRIIRDLVHFLDPETPVIKGCDIFENPFRPITKRGRALVEDHEDDVEIEWIPAEERYNEKLATPDVSMADLIGDIDPIKAAHERLSFSDQAVIHYGIIPRTHRGIFAINELPDLAPRIQVGLLNIMEERDIQIRGFPVSFPIDILIVFSANPEDYTNRGNIITPLKDRIDSQIMTHYPRSLGDSRRITEQEAWSDRGHDLRVPAHVREIVEEIAFEARRCEFVDQNSGVSQRMTISAYESLLSNMERRGLATGESVLHPRVADLYAMVPAVTGKIELVYEGEQEGASTVARDLVGRAVKKVFLEHFPDPRGREEAPAPGEDRRGEGSEPERIASIYSPVMRYFQEGKRVEVSDTMPVSEYREALQRVTGLEELTRSHMKLEREDELPGAMEFVLEGLYQTSNVAKENLDDATLYSDMIMRMFRDMPSRDEV